VLRRTMRILLFVDADAEQRSIAVQRLQALAGLAKLDAERLVDAAVAGAVDQAFELINGAGPVPTSMTTSKADRLRFICDRAGRILSQREVEILFRVTSAAARSIMTTMLATYEEALREKFVERMRSDAAITASGSDDMGLTWTLRFSESGTLDTAWSEITRLRLTGIAEINAARRSVTIPREAQVDGESEDVLKLLGIPEPA
jgi:hypothetical protein